MGAVSGVVDRLRRPEYVDENRCLPCTLANLGIAAVASAVLGVTVWAVATAPAGVATAMASFGVCVVLVYLRGYLVPGTPELTRRYFPAWLLDAFGKRAVAPDGGDGAIDQEALLVGAGALEECRDGTDLCLVDAFRRDWYDAVDRVAAEEAYDELFNVLAVEEGEVTVEAHGSNVQALVDGRFAGAWKSRAALLADLGASSVLADWLDRWDDLGSHDRHALLAGLRLFIDECPACGDVPELGTETVETCCASRRVTTVDCPGCDARLFETAMEG